jgi:hypothetical protein
LREPGGEGELGKNGEGKRCADEEVEEGGRIFTRPGGGGLLESRRRSLIARARLEDRGNGKTRAK